MAAMRQVTVLFSVVCMLAIFAQGSAEKGGSPRGQAGPNQGSSPLGNGNRARHIVKRDAEYDDGFDSDYQPAQESSYERPHRIRVLPGFLH